ncbi:MAG: AraC family transcriptional regulator [Treponema sp.]|jgi:AraC-like DNA-binding protein|nr:AraC family transcriptional regulator [Treponema sp.]
MIKRDILTTDLLYAWSQETDEVYSDIHCHAEYEIYYFIRGDVDYRIEGRHYTMNPESLLLIPPKNFHGVTARSTRPHQRISVHFVPELLDEAERSLLLEMFHASRLYYPDVSMHRIGFLVQSLFNCKDMEEPLQKIAVRHRAVSLLTYIYQLYLQNLVCPAPKDERIQAMLGYLNRNLHDSVSLDTLCREFHISRNHLNVIFRKETGTTVTHYIRIKRLVMARQEILKGCTAEEAAYRAGFNDYSNFYRAYKAFFGIIPSNKTREWPTES